jgi:hypothetical protein
MYLLLLLVFLFRTENFTKGLEFVELIGWFVELIISLFMLLLEFPKFGVLFLLLSLGHDGVVGIK